MVILSLNIINGNTVFNNIPMTFPFENRKESLDFIREQALNILNWPSDNRYVLSKTLIGINIIDIDPTKEDGFWQWEFVLSCKNIREFQPYFKLTREEFISLKKERDRDSKIDSILE